MKPPHLKTCATLLAVVILQCLNSVGFAQGPVLISPTNYVDSYMRNPVFRWHADSSAQYYKIEIANSSTFNASTVVLTDTVEIPKYVPLNPLHTNTRWWRVQSVYPNGSSSAWSSNGIYYLRDYPNKTNVTTNTTPAEISNAISWAKANTPAKVSFGAGVYSLSTAMSHLFDLSNTKDLCLSGATSGATNLTTIVVSNNILAGIAKLDNATNITIENFTIKYDPLPFTELRVTAIQDRRVTFTNVPTTNWPTNAPINAHHFTNNWYARGHLVDTNVPGKFRNNEDAWVVALSNNFANESNGVSVSVTSGLNKLRLNDIYVHMSRGSNANWGFTANRSSNVVFRSVIAYAIPDGFLRFENGSDLSFLSSGFKIEPGRRASTPGGINYGANKSGPWIEGSWFNGGGDDSIALYSRGVVILGVSGRTLHLTNQNYNIGVGDKVDIFNPRDGALLAQDLEVESTNQVSGSLMKSITLKQDIPNTALFVTNATGIEIDQNSQVFNKSRANENFMIKSNNIGPQRRYGIIIRASTGVVKWNTITGCSKGGVAFKNEPSKWMNGLDSHDVLVVSNTFYNNNYEPQIGADICADISVAFVALSNGLAAARPQTNIRIVNNTITNWNLRAIAVADGGNVLVQSNTIGSDNGAFLLLGTNTAILANNCSNLTIRDNVISDTRVMSSRTLVTNCAATLVTNNGEVNPPILYYYIRNKASSKQIAVSIATNVNNLPIVQRANNNGSDQQWDVQPTSSNRFWLGNVATDHWMQPAHLGYTNTNRNTPIVTYAPATNQSQRWEVIPDGEGYYYIKNDYSKLFLRPTNASAATNVVVVQDWDTSDDSLKWSLIPVLAP